MTSLRRSLRPFASLAALLLLFGLFGASAALSQQASPTPDDPPKSSPSSNADFTAAADEVLEQMSQITGLKLETPLKKSLRSREEIRAYVLRQMNEDETPEERYADAKSAEAFGLLPKGFDLDSFMVELLTEQIAGLYDPKAHEFYIADWIPLRDQRMVMAHELTHALEDQHFQIEAWLKAAKPNGDAELAREAVLEGSAMAAMVDYLLQGTGQSLQNLPEFDPSAFVGDLGNSPTLQKAPQFIKDGLIFPYFGGMTFTAAIMKPRGWSALPSVFSNPPLSTQQVMHPALYLAGRKPEKVDAPALDKLLDSQWKHLDDDILGEFGWKEVLKQFLGEERAKPLAAAWIGDRYVLYENKQTRRLLLATHLRLASQEQASRFFGQYSEALEKKYAERSNLLRRPNFFSFDTPDGGVFLRCVGTDCVTLEGGTRDLFTEVNKQLNWTALPEAPRFPTQLPARTARRVTPPASGPPARSSL